MNLQSPKAIVGTCTGILVAAVLISGYFSVIAAPPGSPYAPGETLSPNCAPESTNCTVVPPATSGSNSTITELTGLTTPVSETQGGTGQSSYTKGDILVAPNATSLSKLGVGTDGQILSADSGEATGLKWVDNSGGSGGSGDPMTYVRFTRASENASSSVAVKDGNCTTAFGADWSAATSEELLFYGNGAFDASTFDFVVANDSTNSYFFDGGSSPNQVVTTGAVGVTACIYNNAPIRVTEDEIDQASSDAAKDAECANDFGSDYIAASRQEVTMVAQYYSTAMDLTAAGTTDRFFIAVSGGTSQTVRLNTDNGATNANLVCINDAGLSGGGGGSVTADSLDFTEFTDTMALDASTSITADGTEELSITNTGTGDSFVVEDESSDTTPFVIDASGNVGIKDSSPAYDLEVNGTIASAVGRFTSTVFNSIAYTWPGADGSNGQVLSTNGSGTLSWVDQSGGGGGGGSSPAPVLFTRTGVSSSASDATKDAQCSSEFGSVFSAGVREDILFMGGDAYPNSTSWTFNVAGSTSSYVLDNGTEGRLVSSQASGTDPVMCISDYAPVRLSRTGASSGDSDATKDAACSGDFGADYVAATRQEASYYSSGAYNATHEFNVADSTSAYEFQSGTADTSSVVMVSTSSATLPVLCAYVGNGGGSSTIADDSLDFDKFSDTMALDASTSITANGSEEFSITNIGTGDSFVVEDEASDTSPFTIAANGFVGIGLPNPGQLLHIFDGNILFERNGENSIQFKNTALTDNPIFSIGRLQLAGIGEPEWRIMYDDDSTTEYKIFGIENTGTMASVSQARVSHVEGFKDGDVNPYFRLNSSPDMQLEFGPGDSDATDLIIARREADESGNTNPDTVTTHDPELAILIAGAEKIRATVDNFIIKTTGVEKARFNTDGFLGLGDSDPKNSISNAGGISFTAPNTVNLTSDNQTVPTYNETYIRLTSDNATASNRTFVLDWSQEEGHVVILEWADVSDAGQLVDNNSTSYLNGDWEPSYGDTITLIFNDNLNAWMEVSRSNVSGGSGGGDPSEAPVRFTRSSLSSSASNVTKDSQCSSEFGSSYSAGVVEDILFLGGHAYDGSVWFNVANSTSNAYSIASGTEGRTFSTHGVQTEPVLCVSSYAPTRVTRSTTSSSSNNSTKDSLCTSAFGAEYSAGTLEDMTIHSKGIYDGSLWINLAGSTSNTYYFTSGTANSNSVSLNAAGVQTEPVLCVR